MDDSLADHPMEPDLRSSAQKILLPAFPGLYVVPDVNFGGVVLQRLEVAGNRSNGSARHRAVKHLRVRVSNALEYRVLEPIVTIYTNQGIPASERAVTAGMGALWRWRISYRDGTNGYREAYGVPVHQLLDSQKN